MVDAGWEPARLDDPDAPGDVEQERRQYPRIEARGVAWIFPQGFAGQGFSAPIHDVSLGGVYLKNAPVLEHRFHADLRLLIEDGPAVQAMASVVRIEAKHGFACVFRSIAEHTLDTFRRWLIAPTGAPSLAWLDGSDTNL